MTRGQEVFHQLQSKARADGVAASRQPPTAEYLTRHALESLLDRQPGTEHGQHFVLKGGILLAAYGARRPTKDVDAEAISSTVTAGTITRTVDDIAAVHADDGIEFHLRSLEVQQIREEAEDPGLRVPVNISIGSFAGRVVWDISTGDPIVPRPTMVMVPRILGDDIEILGYAPETVLAEKGVTILERGTTSTRSRDYIDIVRLANIYDVDHDLLLTSAQTVADYRRVHLTAVGPMLAGYGSISQPKWAAWRRKEEFQDICEESFDASGIPITRDLDRRADVVGQHRLGAGAVARVPAPAAGDLVLVIAPVFGHLLIQRGLEDRLGQRLEHPARTGHRDPTSPC